MYVRIQFIGKFFDEHFFSFLHHQDKQKFGRTCKQIVIFALLLLLVSYFLTIFCITENKYTSNYTHTWNQIQNRNLMNIRRYFCPRSEARKYSCPDPKQQTEKNQLDSKQEQSWMCSSQVWTKINPFTNTIRIWTKTLETRIPTKMWSAPTYKPKK